MCIWNLFQFSFHFQNCTSNTSAEQIRCCSDGRYGHYHSNGVGCDRPNGIIIINNLSTDQVRLKTTKTYTLPLFFMQVKENPSCKLTTDKGMLHMLEQEKSGNLKKCGMCGVIRWKRLPPMCPTCLLLAITRRDYNT